VLSFPLATGPKPSEGAKVTVELRLEQAAGAELPAVKLNATRCESSGASPSGEGAVLATYRVPLEAFTGTGHDVVEVGAPAESVKVLGVEMLIEPSM